MSASTHTIDMPPPAEQARKDPFARARPTQFYWIQLKPVYKGRQLAHPERLAQVAVTNERVASLELLRLQVQVDGDPAQPEGNRLEVLVDHNHQRLRFGPPEGLKMVPAGRGLSGFLLAQAIDWCQRRCAGYVVTPIILRAADVGSDDARTARDKLLRAAGFELSYVDEALAEGRAQTGDLAHLISSWDRERVEPLEVASLLAQLREQEGVNLKHQVQINTLRAMIDSHKRNDLGHRFAIGCLMVFSVFQALLLLWIVLR